MKPASFRVYFVTHHDGRLTGHLMRSQHGFLDPAPPSAYGTTQEEVLALLELQLMAAEVNGEDSRNKYYWNETFEVGTTKVTVHPESAVKGRRVIGARQIPLRLSYAWSQTPHGGYRIVLPRFDWWFIIEELSIAADVLSNAVSAALVGEKGKWLYDFRREGDEYVHEWAPQWATKADSSTEENPFAGFPTLQQVADELLLQARKKRLPPAVGRHEEFLPYRDMVVAPRPTSLLVVGGVGVGKTTWIHRLARYLLLEKRKHQVVPYIFSTNRDRILAGQVYFGMWQARCLAIVRELSNERHYLAVGRLVDFVRPMSDGASIADHFEEGLRAEELSLIAEATEVEYERLRLTRPRLVDLFHVVRLSEPAPKDVPQLMMRFLEKSGAPNRIQSDGLVRLVRHLDDFVPGQCFPGKAFRAVRWLLDEAGSEGPPLQAQAVSKFFSRYSGLPNELIADEFALGPEAIRAKLAERVIGQPEACRAAAQVIARLKAGLQDPERPVAALFFVGPTGVGKTELAKQIARFMFGAGADSGTNRLIRLDMSEYMLPGSVQRLLSAESEGMGSLAQRVRQQPLSLVLLDEIEKAHPEVFDLLLALLGEGRMTDDRGHLVDFRMVVFIMTSNLGVSERGPVGFDSRPQDGYIAQVRDHFRPEFFGRLDKVVSFRALSPEDVEQVTDLMLAELEERIGLRQRKLRLRVTPDARARLAQLGYHPTRGARPLKRVIEETVVVPLAVRMAEDPRLRDQVIWVIAQDRAPEGAITIEL